MALLVGLLLISFLGLIVGLNDPNVVLSWLPETKRNKPFVWRVFGGAIAVSFIWILSPSVIDNLLLILFLVSIAALFVGLIKPSFVLKRAPEAKRLHVVMIFGAAAILCITLSSIIPPVEESADSSAQVEQQQEVGTVKAEEEKN